MDHPEYESRYVSYLHPAGDIDAASREGFEYQWLGLSHDQRPIRIVVDMANVTFIDSTGLSMLVRLTQAQHEHGGDVALANPSPMLRRLLEITGLTEFLPIVA